MSSLCFICDACCRLAFAVLCLNMFTVCWFRVCVSFVVCLMLICLCVCLFRVVLFGVCVVVVFCCARCCFRVCVCVIFV